MSENPQAADEQGEAPRRIGVYICHCGGNISDYVDVEGVIANIRDAGDVVVSKTAMFACSEATQQDMVHDIAAHGLDGLVVASCSPKLHTYTFRGVAGRAGLNPFEYTQVNIREQCSWVHTDDEVAATDKATALVRAGIDRTRLTTPLLPMVVETLPHTLVIGGGIAGLRAAIGLADIGLRQSGCLGDGIQQQTLQRPLTNLAHQELGQEITLRRSGALKKPAQGLNFSCGRACPLVLGNVIEYLINLVE